MKNRSHSYKQLLLPDPTPILKRREEAFAWKRKFVEEQIDGPEKPVIEQDFTEATYDCLCAIYSELVRIGDALSGSQEESE